MASIQALHPPGSGEPRHPDRLAELSALTDQLIEAYLRAGRLQEDPFAETRARNIFLCEASLRRLLRDNPGIMVSGGEGTVGQKLLQALCALGGQKIVSVDFRSCPDHFQHAELSYEQVDVTDREALARRFEMHRPRLVFHLAAQRDPGLAEQTVYETINSNVFGTRNLLELATQFAVSRFVLASTGKASRYFTTEVYATTKKLAEWQVAQAALGSTNSYSIVRFTHLLENSLVCEHYDRQIAADRPIDVHAPERYLVAQNLEETCRLLLNAACLAQPGASKILATRNLGWPVETLELALYKRRLSGKPLPIYFRGVPPGYEECLFRGQFDWNDKGNFNLLLNVLENASKTFDSSGDLVLCNPVPMPESVMREELKNLEEEMALADEEQLRAHLGQAMSRLVDAQFREAPAELLLNILKWGIEPHEPGTPIPAYHRDVIQLVSGGLEGRVDKVALKQTNFTPGQLRRLIESGARSGR